VKQQELEKRKRANENQRRALAQSIEVQLKDKINDHEELLRRKKEAQAAA
jgi:hypothetical protein